MARPRSKPMMFAKVKTTENRWAQFHDDLEKASMRSLDENGRKGAAVARTLMTRTRTGESKRRIGWARAGKEGLIYVGTIQGSYQEHGRSGGQTGSLEPLRFLHRGMLAAMQGMIPGIRRRAGGGLG